MAPEYNRSLRFFEFGLAACLISLFSAFLLDRLLLYQEIAEKARVDSVVLNLKSALRIRMGEMMIDSRAHRWRDLEQENPFAWLEKTPENYCGVTVPGNEIMVGCWVYQPNTHQLIYRLKRDEHFQSEIPGQSLIRYSVVASLSTKSSYTSADRNDKAPGVADTVNLVLLSPYHWF